MHRILGILLVLISGVSYSQDYVVDSVRNSKLAPNKAGKEYCIAASGELNRAMEKVNSKLWFYETHPDAGYDISHQIRIQINGMVYIRTNPYVVALNHYAYEGNGAECRRQLDQGLALVNKIYDQNIILRKSNAQTR